MAAKFKSPAEMASSSHKSDAMPQSSLTMKQKTNNKLDLSKSDLIQLLTCLEGELQARDVVIATLKMEKVKQMVKLQQQGRLSQGLGAAGDPFAALQRDSSYAVLKSNDLSSVEEESSVYDNQLEKLEQLILQQRKAMARLTAHLKQAEKINARVVSELEDEKRKREHDTAQGDDVTYALEKDRTRLAQELEVERQGRKKVEKELTKVKETLEEERSRQQQIVLLLVAERNKIIMKWIEERRRSEDLAQILAEEKGRVDSMAEGLEEESKKALLMEAELERMAAQCSHEQRQFRSQLEMKDKRCKDLETEVEIVRREADSLHKQLAEAHQVAMFQAGVQQQHGAATAAVTSGSVTTGRIGMSPRNFGVAGGLLSTVGSSMLGSSSPPIPAGKPTIIPPGPQIPPRTAAATLQAASPKLGSKGSPLRPISPSNVNVDDHGSSSPNAGVASSVAKTVQPTASVSSVPVSGPATGIAQSVIRPSGGGVLRGVAYSTAAGSPSQGAESHSTSVLPGRLPHSSAVHDASSSSSSVSSSSSSPATASNSNSATTATGPGGSRVAISASPGSKVFTSTSQGKVTFHVTTTMASRTVGGASAGAGRGMPPPVPPNKPQVPPKKDGVVMRGVGGGVSGGPGSSAMPMSMSSGDMTVDRGQPISFEVSPQKVGQQALKFGITISKDKIHITNAQGAGGGGTSATANEVKNGGRQEAGQVNPLDDSPVIAPVNMNMRSPSPSSILHVPSVVAPTPSLDLDLLGSALDDFHQLLSSMAAPRGTHHVKTSEFQSSSWMSSVVRNSSEETWRAKKSNCDGVE